MKQASGAHVFSPRAQWEILHCVQDDSCGFRMTVLGDWRGDSFELWRDDSLFVILSVERYLCWSGSEWALVELPFRACFVRVVQYFFTRSTQYTHKNVYTVSSKLSIICVYTPLQGMKTLWLTSHLNCPQKFE